MIKGSNIELDAKFEKQQSADLKRTVGNVVNPFNVRPDALEKVNQKAFIQWCSVASQFGVALANDPKSYEIEGYAKASSVSYRISENEQLLKWVYANNLNQSNGIAGNIARQMGAKSGLPDLALDLVNHNGFSGLRMEMKRESERKKARGGLSSNQVEWQSFLIENNYKYAVCYSWQEARAVACEYLGIKIN